MQAASDLPLQRCSTRSETLHTIAAKFQTNWMQIWSANHEKMDEVMVVAVLL